MKSTFYKRLEDNKVILSKEELGEGYRKLVANTTDGAREKHVPVYEREGDEVTITVGEVLHSMSDVHHISFIALFTDRREIVKDVYPSGEPVAKFTLEPEEKVLEVYEYCNLHGLWLLKVN